MVSSILAALSLILLAPWSPDEVRPDPALEVRTPVLLVVQDAPAVTREGFDAALASRRVVEGAAERLRASGAVVRPDLLEGAFVVSPPLRFRQPISALDAAGGEVATTRKPVTLSVRFNTSSTPYASGSETRFGGQDDASWRLASRVQQHVVGGLREVLGHDVYSRGAVEQAEDGPAEGRPAGLEAGSPWVTAYPLFATNPSERALLEWPETLGLLSTALANAVYDYLNSPLPAPPRLASEGWRLSAPWRPVSPRSLYAADHSPRLALTFDGGASSVPTPAILKALRDAGVRATMFMTADFVERNPELVVQMAREGHEFGNHSSTHPDMTRLSDQAILDELDRLEAAVRALTGKSTRPWFRPPFGASNDRLMRVAAQHGYYTIMWTADSADWRPEVSASTVESRLLRYAAPGAILIQHLGSPQSAEVLAGVLRRLKEQGMELGTLSEVLGPLD